jgi:hypothetical protein
MPLNLYVMNSLSHTHTHTHTHILFQLVGIYVLPALLLIACKICAHVNIYFFQKRQVIRLFLLFRRIHEVRMQPFLSPRPYRRTAEVFAHEQRPHAAGRKCLHTNNDLMQPAGGVCTQTTTSCRLAGRFCPINLTVNNQLQTK